MLRKTRTWGAALYATALVVTACSSDAASEIDHVSSTEPARYVGEVEDSDVRVAVVADAAKARVFFCGGDESFATETRWFNLELDEAELSADDGDWHLRATRDEESVYGEITHDPDAPRAFSTALVAKGTLSGLYEGKAQCGRIGLIVSQAEQGSSIEAQGACVGEGHPPEQVNPITPITSEAGKIRVQAPSEDATPLLQAATLTPL
jgi:hypothetical protein